MAYMEALKLILGFCTVTFLMCSFSACTHSDNASIKCVANYIKMNVDEGELSRFKDIEGIEVWRTWDSLTAHLADDSSIIESCGVYDYMDDKKMPMHTFRGEVTFVFLVHSYLKTGDIDFEHITSEVEKVISD